MKTSQCFESLARSLGLKPRDLEEMIKGLRELGAGEAAAVLEAGIGRVLRTGLRVERMASMLLEELGGEGYRLIDASWIEGFEGVVLVFREVGGDRVLETYVQRDGFYLVYTVPVFNEAGSEEISVVEEAIIEVDRESRHAGMLVEKLSRIKGAELSMEPEADDKASLVITIHVDSARHAPSIKHLEALAGEIVSKARSMLAARR